MFSTKKLIKTKYALLFVLLTYSERVFLELCGEVGDVGHAVEVSLQDVPTHFVVEWVAEFGWYLKEERAIGVIRPPTLISVLSTLLFLGALV